MFRFAHHFAIILFIHFIICSAYHWASSISHQRLLVDRDGSLWRATQSFGGGDKASVSFFTSICLFPVVWHVRFRLSYKLQWCQYQSPYHWHNKFEQVMICIVRFRTCHKQSWQLKSSGDPGGQRDTPVRLPIQEEAGLSEGGPQNETLPDVWICYDFYRNDFETKPTFRDFWSHPVLSMCETRETKVHGEGTLYMCLRAIWSKFVG